MSQVGNVEKMYGNTLSIITSNAPGNKILDYGQTHVFTENSIIITSPIKKTEKDGTTKIEDKGIPSMFCVDYEGKPLRLTYTIQPGNGLISDTQTPDIIRMNVDKHTLIATETYYSGGIGVPGELKVAAYNLIDNNTSLIDVNNNLVVNPDCIIDNISLKTASRYVGGDANLFNQFEAPNYKQANPPIIYVNKENLVDNKTIVIDNSYERQFYDQGDIERYFDNTPWQQNAYTKLKVETKNLDKATKTTYGIVRSDNETITTSNGVFGVNTAKLTKISTKGGSGIITAEEKGKANEWYYCDAGKLHLVPEFMNKTSSSKWGVCRVDGRTILADTTGIINVNTSKLQTATTSSVGVVQVDGQTITASGTGKISVNTKSLSKATTSTMGVVKFDGQTIGENASKQLEVKGYNTLLADVKRLNDEVGDLNTKVNELTSIIKNLSSQLTNTNSTLFNLYTDATRVAKFTSINKKFTWVASTNAYMGPGNTQVYNAQLYLNYKPGVSLTIDTSNFKNWVKLRHVQFPTGGNNGTRLPVQPGVEFKIKNSNEFDMYQMTLIFDITTPPTVATSSGSVNFYGPNGDLLESIPVTFKFAGSTDNLNIFKANTYNPINIGSVVTPLDFKTASKTDAIGTTTRTTTVSNAISDIRSRIK